eukprot:241178-Rhodomonas_salina.1
MINRCCGGGGGGVAGGGGWLLVVRRVVRRCCVVGGCGVVVGVGGGSAQAGSGWRGWLMAATSEVRGRGGWRPKERAGRHVLWWVRQAGECNRVSSGGANRVARPGRNAAQPEPDSFPGRVGSCAVERVGVAALRRH